MATLSHQQIQVTGPEVTLVAAEGSADNTLPGERVFLWVKNASGASRTVTIGTPSALDQFGQDLPSIVVTVPGGGERMIGPLVRQLQGAFGVVAWNYSDGADLTVAAVRI